MIIKILDSEKKNKLWNNECFKFLWLCFSCILGIITVALIMVFFAFFGCAYEFAKCYIDKKENLNEDDYENGNKNNNNDNNYELDENGNRIFIWTRNEKIILYFIIFLGIICQPLYLLIYTLFCLIECYRRFNCWFYYV